MPKLTLVPRHGLANRLGAISSAVHLSRRLNTPLEVIWIPSHELGAKYSSLFRMPNQYRVLDLDPLGSAVDKLRFAYKGMRSDRKVYQWIRDWRYDLILEDIDEPCNIHPPQFDPESDILSMKGKNVLVSTCFRFYETSGTVLIAPSPTRDIEIEIDAFISSWPSKVVGVHIRRTDHDYSIKHAPIEMFISAIDSRLSADPSAAIFLCTDCLKTQQAMMNIYGSRIFARPKVFGRSSSIAIRDAVVDLYLLSYCSEIIKSPGSTFSIVASELHRFAGVHSRKLLLE